VARLVGRLREDVEAWGQRDLAEHGIRSLFLDGWSPRVLRIGKKRVRVPVLVTLGVCADGRRVVLDMRIAGEESAASWSAVVRSARRERRRAQQFGGAQSGAAGAGGLTLLPTAAWGF
jgi:transposase-like protein